MVEDWLGAIWLSRYKFNSPVNKHIKKALKNKIIIKFWRKINMNTFETIKNIIVEELGVEAEKITMETKFEDDLDADSLDLFQVINEIEDELDITVDTDENLQTVADLVNYIENQK